MSSQVDYDVIRTTIADLIIANLPWATATSTFDYSPTDPALPFGNLPAVIVDFDRSVNVEWAEVDQGYLKGIPFLIEVYVEIPSSDTTGRVSSIDVAQKLNEVEALFKGDPTIGANVKNSTIRSSKVESIRIDAVKLGVLVRFAWVALVVFVVV